MRVTLPLKYNQMVNDLNRKNSELSKLAASVSSGRRLNRPSDDPLAWARSMGIKRGLEELETFQANMDFALHWNRAAENAMGELSELFLSAKETAIRAMGAPSQEAKHAHTQQLDQIFQQAMALANSRHENRYIFSVNSNEAPFRLDPGGEAKLLGPEDLDGLSDSFQVRIGYGLSQDVGVDGKSLFYTGDGEDAVNSLQTLLDLKKAMEEQDSTGITEQMGKLEKILENFGRQTTLAGNRQAALEARSAALASLSLEEEIRLSDLQDADLLSTITQLQAKKTTFEAALKVTSLLDGLSLAKYI